MQQSYFRNGRLLVKQQKWLTVPWCSPELSFLNFERFIPVTISIVTHTRNRLREDCVGTKQARDEARANKLHAS